MARVLTTFHGTSRLPGYAPEQVGALAHEANEPGVLWIDIDRILDSPYQHQEHLDPADFQALVESIQKEGFLTALNVNAHPQRAGYYFLTAGGHQRRDAARAAGLPRIPVFVEPPLDPIRLAFRAARENAIQVNHNRVNLGYLFLHIQAEFGLSQEAIAAELGKARSFVATAIRAATSEPDIQALLCEKPDSLRATLYLRRLDSPKDRAPIIARLRAGESTTDGVRAEVEALLHHRKATRTPRHPSDASERSAAASGRAERTVLPEREGYGMPEAVIVAKGASGTDVWGESSPQMRDSTHEQEIPEEDHRLYERVAKLIDIVSRFEAYGRMRTPSPLAPQEHALLLQLGSMVQELLT